MGQTLPHGVYLPDNGERNCYVGLSQNWQKLDNLLGNKGDKVSFSQTLTEGVEIGKITINGEEVSLYHTDYSSDIASKANATDLTAHTSDSDIHVTPAEKNTWNSKQDALSSQQIANINDVVNKANDSNVVHKSGDETIGGTKTFISGIISYVTSNNSDNGYTSFFGGTNVYKGAWIELVGKDNPATSLAGSFEIIASNNDGVRKSLQGTPDGSLFWSGSSFTCPNGGLGTSSKKWKTLNGVNPGALSLPNVSNGINIDTTNWNLTGVANTYTPTSDGYICLRVENTSTSPKISWYINSYNTYSDARTISTTGAVSSGFIPVVANTPISILITATSIRSAKFYPCIGNV